MLLRLWLCCVLALSWAQQDDEDARLRADGQQLLAMLQQDQAAPNARFFLGEEDHTRYYLSLEPKLLDNRKFVYRLAIKAHPLPDDEEDNTYSLMADLVYVSVSTDRYGKETTRATQIHKVPSLARAMKQSHRPGMMDEWFLAWYASGAHIQVSDSSRLPYSTSRVAGKFLDPETLVFEDVLSPTGEGARWVSPGPAKALPDGSTREDL